MAPASRTRDDAQKRADRQLASELEPRLQLLPCPTVHADFAPATALAAPHEHRAAGLVEIAFGQLERLVDPEPGSPEDHDQGPHPAAVRPVARSAHDGDDFLDLGRVGRVAVAFVAGRLAGVESGHRRRRSASPRAIEHEFGHDGLQADRGRTHYPLAW
jgi:hypothetical protein